MGWAGRLGCAARLLGWPRLTARVGWLGLPLSLGRAPAGQRLPAGCRLFTAASMVHVIEKIPWHEALYFTCQVSSPTQAACLLMAAPADGLHLLMGCTC